MAKRKFIGILLIAWIFFSGSACVPRTTSMVKGKEAEQGSVLFADDFSKTPNGWGTGDQGGGVIEYLDGGLHFQVENANFDFWSVAGKNYHNVQIEVDALKRGGPDNNHFGIICRYVDRNNFYFLVVSSDGYYGAAKLKDGRYSMIGMDQLLYSDVIHSGQATNHLRVDCVDEALSLYVNGLELVKVRDADFLSGDVGLIAGAYQEKGVDILFDQFVVKAPEN